MAFGLSAASVAMIGTGVGAVTGLMNSGGGSGPSQTNTKEPWAEAAPWLREQLKKGQSLQQQYEQTPFNAQQQTGYQNTFGDLNNFRSNVAPGLMQFANNAMTGPGYQRQQLERPGQGGYGARPQQQQPGGLMQGPFGMAQGGLMGSQYARPDFAPQQPPRAEAPQTGAMTPDMADEFMRRLEQQQLDRVRHPTDGGGA